MASSQQKFFISTACPPFDLKPGYDGEASIAPLLRLLWPSISRLGKPVTYNIWHSFLSLDSIGLLGQYDASMPADLAFSCHCAQLLSASCLRKTVSAVPLQLMLLCVVFQHTAGSWLPITICRRPLITACSQQMAWVTSAELAAQLCTYVAGKARKG